jgi:hypothetical protein
MFEKLSPAINNDILNAQAVTIQVEMCLFICLYIQIHTYTCVCIQMYMNKHVYIRIMDAKLSPAINNDILNSQAVTRFLYTYLYVYIHRYTHIFVYIYTNIYEYTKHVCIRIMFEKLFPAINNDILNAQAGTIQV